MKRLKPESIIATFFGIGKFPKAPGTLASFVATILVALLFYQPHITEIEGEKYLIWGGGVISPNYIVHVLVLLSLALHAIGVWSSDKYSKLINIKDPKSAVIDEVAGIFTASSLVALVYSLLLFFNEKEYILYLIVSYWFFPVVFILFRIFDILKPWHVGWADKKFEGGFGIMIDDQIAAAYSAISFYIIFFGLKYFGVLDQMVSV